MFHLIFCYPLPISQHVLQGFWEPVRRLAPEGLLQGAAGQGPHDERVEAYGACGIYVMKMEGSPKLLRSCSAKVAPGMSLFTESERVIRSRQTALELLLSDHQGDCKAPCVRACPGETDCQGYVGLIANGKFREALKLIKEQHRRPDDMSYTPPLRRVR